MYNVISAILFQALSSGYSRNIVSNLFHRMLAIQEDEMSEHYHDAGDLRFLKEMGKLAPTEFNAWLSLDNIVRP